MPLRIALSHHTLFRGVVSPSSCTSLRPSLNADLTVAPRFISSPLHHLLLQGNSPIHNECRRETHKYSRSDTARSTLPYPHPNLHISHQSCPQLTTHFYLRKSLNKLVQSSSPSFSSPLHTPFHACLISKPWRRCASHPQPTFTGVIYDRM